MAIDLLDAETPIINRLKAKIPDARIASVASIAGLLPQDVTKLLLAAGAVFVKPDAGGLFPEGGSFEQIGEDGEWVLIVVVKHLPDTTAFAATHVLAGSLMGRVLEALSAWNPGAALGYQPMRYLGREEPEFSPGYVEFPLRFAAPRWFAVSTP